MEARQNLSEQSLALGRLVSCVDALCKDVQAFENGSYVARPELQESYRQSLEAAQQNTV